MPQSELGSIRSYACRGILPIAMRILRAEFGFVRIFFALSNGGVTISSAKDMLVNEEIKLKEVRVPCFCPYSGGG